MNSGTLKIVLGLPLSKVDTWLDGRVIGEAVGGEPFNWDLFASVTASRAGNERNLSWAHIALHVYENLARRSSPELASSFMFSAMNLRARMIMELGAREGDAILDPEFVAVWTLGFVTITLEEALRISSSPEHWKDLPPDKLLQVRRIKNALNVIELISDSGVLKKHPELEGWLRIKDRLL